MSVQKGLGRGLGALLGDLPQQDADRPVRMVPLQKVEPSPNQPRKNFDPAELEDLAQSIRTHGVLQPLAVRSVGGGYYQIVAGERRWRAARMADVTEIPVLVVEADDRTAAELTLIENLQRQDLNPMEEASGYRQLMDSFRMTQEQVADAVVKSRSAVANALRLLRLPAGIQEMVADGRISPGHARAIMTLPEKQQASAAQKIAALQLSVRQAELMCKALGKKPPAPRSTLEVDYLAECEKQLSRKLGRGVKIVRGKRKGRFLLEFYGDDDLQLLLEALQDLPKKKERKP